MRHKCIVARLDLQVDLAGDKWPYRWPLRLAGFRRVGVERRTLAWSVP